MAAGPTADDVVSLGLDMPGGEAGYHRYVPSLLVIIANY
jgi:formate dehydrogenase maturation protein FdhE